MVYNFNLGIGWASSGVEYAQSYRANLLRKAGIEAKYVFTDMFPSENIEHMTKNIGFYDEEIIWLYTFFTDTKIAPVSFTLKDLEATFPDDSFTFSRNGKQCRYSFTNNSYYTVYMVGDKDDLVHRVEIVCDDKLIRKDYYTYCKIYSELYSPFEKKAHLYGRRFYNEDGTTAYEEIIDEDSSLYRFKNKVLYSKEELVGYLVERLALTKDDVVIVDRTTGIGQSIVQNAGPAKLGFVVHADHFSEGSTDENNILWNNYYEYSFSISDHADFFITATDAQNKLMREQFVKYGRKEPTVVTIPVGSLDELKRPEGSRKKHSLITASRLANEKHCDWLIEATAKIHEVFPDVTLDIYGKGGEENALRELIRKNDAEGYIRLMGQWKLDEVYKNYEVYFSGSQSEGFGLTLLEAIGSGLPIVGFDVRYGNQTFIDNGKNGYKIPINDSMDKDEKVELLAAHVIKMFSEDDLDAFAKHSYKKAEEYLTDEVVKRWIELLK